MPFMSCTFDRLGKLKFPSAVPMTALVRDGHRCLNGRFDSDSLRKDSNLMASAIALGQSSPVGSS